VAREDLRRHQAKMQEEEIRMLEAEAEAAEGMEGVEAVRKVLGESDDEFGMDEDDEDALMEAAG